MPRIRPPTVGRAAPAVPVEPVIEQTDVPFQSQETEVTEKETPAVVEEDASAAFQKQIEALRRSEQVQKERTEQLARERDEAVRKASEREDQISQLRKQNVESQTEAVESALAAAQAAAEGAERDIASAIEAGDPSAQAKAYRRLSKAEADIARLEDGKQAIEAEAKRAPSPEPIENQPQPKPQQLPKLAADWLKAHPEYIADPRKNAEVQHYHWKVVDEGHEPWSTDYFEALEVRLGLRDAPIEDPTHQIYPIQEQRTAPVVSAPVSREVPMSSSTARKPGQVTLSAAQKEAAKLAGITEAEYAKQVIRLQQEKMNGNYTGGQ